MSSLLNYNAQISLAYSPSMRFDFNVATDMMLYVSTIILAGETMFPLTTFVRPWLVRAGINEIHLYTDTINTTLNSQLFNNTSLTSSYTFLHHVDNFNNISYNDPLNCNAEYLVSGNNTLSIILTGTNYRSIN
jgi:hypothetical protein